MDQNEFALLVALDEQIDIQPAEYALTSDLITMGRSSTCEIVVRRTDVSRLHARIEREGLRYVLQDAGSANGTFVNSRQIYNPHPLKHRDVIGLGDATPMLRFLDPDPTRERRGRLRYDESRITFFFSEQELHLTPTEQKLMYYLYQHRGVVCRYESCAEAVWGENYEPGRDTRLDGVVRDTRAKLDTIERGAREILKTHHGKGYELIG